MRTIWKYTLEIENIQTVEVPAGALPLSIQAQFDRPCVWLDIPETNTVLTEEIVFLTFGTGHPVEENMEGMEDYKFLGTYQIMGGSLVFHVFYKVKR